MVSRHASPDPRRAVFPRAVPSWSLIVVLSAACASGPDPSPVPASSSATPEASTMHDTENWVWTFRSDPAQALFGPPASEALLVVECDPDRVGHIVHTVYALAPEGGEAELRIEGNGENRSIALGVIESELAGGWIWSGGSDSDSVEAPFTAGTGPVTFTLDGARWTVPDSAPARAVIEACQR